MANKPPDDLNPDAPRVGRRRRCEEVVAARLAEIEAAEKEPVPTAKMLPGVIVLDTETTGVRPGEDHLLTIGICDQDGREVAYFEVCPPPECASWPRAQRVNGISPADVLGKPSIDDIRPELQRILDAADTIVCYNAEFDLGFLRAAGFVCPQREVDVMLDFARICGEWSEYFGGYKWQSLSRCAAYYDCPDFAAHNSLADAQATAWCWSRMNEDEAGER